MVVILNIVYVLYCHYVKEGEREISDGEIDERAEKY